MKRIALSALSVFGLCLSAQSPAFAQFGVGVSEGSYGADRYQGASWGDDLSPGEFMTQPEFRAFGPTGDENGPTAPFYAEPMYNYTGWFRPRAVGRTMSERCYIDSFRPRGLGRLFAKSATGMRLDYRPYQLADWRSPHGPAYYPVAEDPRCPHCDKQGCCLSSLFGCCGTCGGGILGICGACGSGDCDGQCDTGACDTCDTCAEESCGLGCQMRNGFSTWITRPRDFALRRLPRRIQRRQALAGCQTGHCGNANCATCGTAGCATCATGVKVQSAECGCQIGQQAPGQVQQQADTGFIRHEETFAQDNEDEWNPDALMESQPVNRQRTAYEEAPAGVVN